MTMSDWQSQHNRDLALIESLREQVAALTDQLAAATMRAETAEALIPRQRPGVGTGERF